MFLIVKTGTCNGNGMISLQSHSCTHSSSVVTLSPTNYLVLAKSQIAHSDMNHTSSVESTSRFILSASLVLSRFSFSSTCRAIFVRSSPLSASVTLSLQAQNLCVEWDVKPYYTILCQSQKLTFQQILPTLIDFRYPLDCLHGSWDWTRLNMLIG